MHQWFFPTRTFRSLQGKDDGTTGADDAMAAAWATGIGAESFLAADLVDHLHIVIVPIMLGRGVRPRRNALSERFPIAGLVLRQPFSVSPSAFLRARTLFRRNWVRVDPYHPLVLA